MKKTLLAVILTLSTLNSFAGNKNQSAASGTSFYFGLSYSNIARPQFDKYMTAVSDSMYLDKPLIAKHGIGVAVGVSFRMNHSELDLGGSYISGVVIKGNSSVTNSGEKLKTKSIDIHLGYNYYITGPLFAGMDIGALSNDGKFTTSGSTTAFEAAPESHNPFKGYIFFVRPKVGAFFPFKKDKTGGVKINAFYNLGVSKYEFYKNDIFQDRLKNYTGPTKSAYRGIGLQVSVSIGR